MKVLPVRIKGMTISNFKNVVSGHLDFLNDKKIYKASVLGLYGQNGSGKTAMIDSLDLLKNALCGMPIPEKYADYINVDSEYATIEFEFSLAGDIDVIPVFYQFSIRAFIDESQQNTEGQKNEGSKKQVMVFNEILKCPILSDKKAKIGRLIDTQTDLFTPIPKKNLLVGKDKALELELMVSKKITSVQSRSFIFSKELLTAIRNRAEKGVDQFEEKDEFFYYASIIESLVNFGNNGLFVINTTTSGLISLNAQPISFKYREESIGAQGTIMIPLESSVLIGSQEKDITEKVILNMNTVLSQIVPGLTIGLNLLATETMSNGSVGYRIQLISNKNNKTIPLKYESEGIKKIVSILNLLIVVYNNESITVAIDELDSGIFEYLLGEILKIISEKGKGQLIFTSHNLRPLETLDKGFVAFTTTNPENRYVRIVGVKENNNLRDFYYRDITLGEQKESLYDYTNNSEIAFAFRDAGAYCGS